MPPENPKCVHPISQCFSFPSHINLCVHPTSHCLSFFCFLECGFPCLLYRTCTLWEQCARYSIVWPTPPSCACQKQGGETFQSCFSVSFSVSVWASASWASEAGAGRGMKKGGEMSDLHRPTPSNSAHSAPFVCLCLSKPATAVPASSAGLGPFLAPAPLTSLGLAGPYQQTKVKGPDSTPTSAPFCDQVNRSPVLFKSNVEMSLSLLRR